MREGGKEGGREGMYAPREGRRKGRRHGGKSPACRFRPVEKWGPACLKCRDEMNESLLLTLSPSLPPSFLHLPAFFMHCKMLPGKAPM